MEIREQWKYYCPGNNAAFESLISSKTWGSGVDEKAKPAIMVELSCVTGSAQGRGHCRGKNELVFQISKSHLLI